MKLYGNLSKNGQAVVSMMVTLIRELDNYKTYLDQSSGSDGYYGQVLLERRGEKLNNLRNGNHYVTQGLDSVVLSAFYDIAKNSSTEKEFTEPDWFINDALILTNNTAGLDKYLKNLTDNNVSITSAQRLRILEKYKEIINNQPEPSGFLEKLLSKFSYSNAEILTACAQLLETKDFDNLKGAQASGQLAKIAKLKIVDPLVNLHLFQTINIIQKHQAPSGKATKAPVILSPHIVRLIGGYMKEEGKQPNRGPKN